MIRWLCIPTTDYVVPNSTVKHVNYISYKDATYNNVKKLNVCKKTFYKYYFIYLLMYNHVAMVYQLPSIASIFKY